MLGDDIYDFRYPFESIFEFFYDGYFLRIEALHLVIGFFFLLYGTFRIFRTNLPIYGKFSLTYFLSSIYTNYCFLIFGISYSECFGIVAAASVFLYGGMKNNPITVYMLSFALIALVHLIIVLPIYEYGITNAEIFERAVPTFRIFVIAINAAIFVGILQNYISVEQLYKLFLPFLAGVIIVYYIQIAIFLTGALPYGSFSPAGWAASPLPSFGSVSIERGHFGKFFVPLFPLIIYFWIRFQYRVVPILFITICLINLSASSLSFFIAFVALSTIFLSKFAKSMFIVIYSFLGVLVFVFSPQLTALFDKIRDLAFLGSDEGGRSFDLFFLINQRFPLGYGYGGSSFRNAHGFDFDLNNALVALGGMLSIAAVPILIIFFLLIFKLLRTALRNSREMPVEAPVMIVSLIGICFIFSADILWFVPSVWLPVLVMYGIFTRTPLRDVDTREASPALARQFATVARR